MNAVGIDVSKGKSMVAALRPMGEVALLPQEFLHTEIGLEQMAYAIIALGEDTRVVMEATGRYHEPVAAALYEYGIYVCVLNPLFIKQSGGGSIRKVKTDKADAMKIAKYGLDNWVDLREYTPMDTVRQQLKLCSRQYNLYMKTVVSLQNNLISLADKTFPGVNELFSSPERADGHQKWVDFVMTFWHCDCVCRVSEKAFTERYQKWCKRKGYNFSAEKALDVYAGSCGHFTTLPKNDNTKLLITTAAQQLLAGKMTLAALRAEMTRLAIEEIPYFRLCTYEMDRKETSYSYQTMEYFKETYPQDEFYFIIGADSLFNLETWKCPERLLKTAVILAAYRDDAGAPKEMRRQITYLKEKYACDIRLLRTPVMPVSSSEIRQMIRGGETEDLPIPKKVADYIDLNRLYQVSEHDGNNT